jgi:hypothetical protein
MKNECKRCNPWFSLWACPRSTMRVILDEDPRRWTHLIMVVSGAILGLFAAFSVTPPTQQVAFGDMFITLVGYAIAGALFNIIAVYIMALLLRWVGHWFHGTGSYVDVRSAVAWSNVPLIWLGVLKGFELLLFGTIFPWAMVLPSSNPAMEPLAYIFAAINILLTAWIIVILVRTVAEAHQFSAWLSFFSLLISAAIFFIALAVFAGIADFFNTLPNLMTFNQPSTR